MKFNINEDMHGNDEYIDKSSDRVSHIFNNIWLSRYSRQSQVVFDNGYEFKQELTPLLQEFDIKYVLRKKTPQANAQAEQCIK